MKLIGVTGGVGSGKSSILAYLEQHYDAAVLRSDEAAYRLESPGGMIYRPMVELLAAHGGRDLLLAEDGTIVKREMAARIFRDPELLQKVNALVHPAVKEFILKEVERVRAEGKTKYFFLEAALLIECGYENIVDELWYIYCDPEVRRARLRESRGYSDAKIDGIMQSQLSEEAFRAHADVVIDNSGTPGEAFRQVDAALSGAAARE